LFFSKRNEKINNQSGALERILFIFYLPWKQGGGGDRITVLVLWLLT